MDFGGGLEGFWLRNAKCKSRLEKQIVNSIKQGTAWKKNPDKPMTIHGILDFKDIT